MIKGTIVGHSEPRTRAGLIVALRLLLDFEPQLELAPTVPLVGC